MGNFSLGEAVLGTSVDLKGLEHGLTGAERATRESASRLGGMLQTAFGFVTGTAIVGGIQRIGESIKSMVLDAAPVENIRAAFNGIAASVGRTGDEMLIALQKGAQGMVSQRDLMMTFNQAAQLVGTDFAQKLPDAMQYLGKVAAATGQDMGFMLDSLVKGVGRLSPMILDNLGIQVNLSEATERAAQMFGVEADQLTKAQQQAGMMDVVLEKLRANTAAMPEVAGSTSQRMAELSATMQNLKDHIGIALLPVLNSALGLILQFIPAVQGWIDKVISLAQGALPGLSSAIAGIVNAFRGMFAPALQDANGIIQDFTTHLGTRMDSVRQVVTTALDTARSAFSSAVEDMRNAWEQHGSAIVQRVTENFENVRAIIIRVIDLVAPLVQGWLAQLKALFEDVWPAIADIVMTAATIMQETIGKALETILAFWNDHGEAIMRVADTVFQTVLSTIRTVIYVIQQVVKAALDIIHGDWSSAWERIRNAAEAVWEGIKTIIRGAIEIIKSILEIAWSAIEGHVKQAWETISNAIRDKVDGIRNDIETKWNGIIGFFRGLPGTFWQLGRDMLQGLWNGLADIWNQIVNWINEKLNSLPGVVKHVLGISSPSTIMIEIGKQFLQGFLVGLTEEERELLSKLASLGAKIADAVNAWAEALAGIEDYKHISLKQIHSFMYDMKLLLIEMANTFRVYGAGWFSVMAQWMPNAEQATGVLKTFVESLDAIASHKYVSLKQIRLFLDDMKKLLIEMADTFRVYGEHWFSVIAQWLPNGERAAATIKTFVDALAAIATHKYVSLQQIRLFIGDMKKLLGEMAATFGIYGKNWFSVIAEWLPNAERAAGTIGTFVDSLTAIATYKRVSIDQIRLFLKDMEALLVEMANAFREYGAKWFSVMAEWMPNAEKAAGTIGTFIDSLTAIATYKRVSIDQIRLFLKDMEALLVEMANTFREYGAKWFSAMGEWAPNAEKAVNLMKAGVELLGDVATFSTEYLSPQKFAVLFDIMRFTLEGFTWMASKIAPAIAAASAVAASYFAVVFSTMSTGLQFLSALAEATLPAKDKINEFVDLLKYILDKLNGALNVSGDISSLWGQIASRLGEVGLILPTYTIPQYTIPEVNFPTPTLDWSGIVGKPPAYRGGGGGGGGGGGTAKGMDELIDLLTLLIQAFGEFLDAQGWQTDVDDLARELELKRRMRYATAS